MEIRLPLPEVDSDEVEAKGGYGLSSTVATVILNPQRGTPL